MLQPSDRQLREEIAAHRARVDRYRAGELSNDEFRPMRLSYGLYYQLDHTSHMQRIKIPGGMLTAAQMDCLNEVADRYGRGVAHVTTRQDIQIHWVPLAEVGTMYELLHESGITTRGACADSIRNVTACPHSGLLAEEPFDVGPYAQLINDYFLFHPLNLTLPRKFKIGISNCARDCAQAVINDIGLYAHARRSGSETVRGFAVQAAGGLGSQPSLAIGIREFVPVEDTLIVCEALVRLQHRAGERKNRSRARMKYLMKRLGPVQFGAALDEEIARIERSSGDRLRAETAECVGQYRVAPPRHAPAPLPDTSGSPAFSTWAETNVRRQREEGYFLATVTVPFGDYSTAQGRVLAALAQEYGNGTLRTTNEQNFLIPYLSGGALESVHERLEAAGLAEAYANHVSDVVSCPGADYCSLAVTRSMGMAERIRAHVREAAVSPADFGELHVKISGCPNSCGQHHVGDIGLTGMMVKGKDGRERPHYSLMVGGAVGEETSTLGRRLAGRYPEEEAPQAVLAIARCFASERMPEESFQQFVQRVGMDRVNAAARNAVNGGRA